MKNRKKIGGYIAFALACGIFAVGGIGLANTKNVSATTIENAYILEEYSLNKVFTIPKATLKVDDKTVISDYAYLVFPSGKAIDKSPVVLDEEGVYSLVYYATVDGQKVKATKEFTVAKQIYKVSDEKSSAYFGTSVKLPMLEGVVVNLANGDKFIYDEIIDLSDNTENDSLIKIAMFTENEGKADVGEMVIRLSDIYDESNYLNIHIKNIADAGDWALRQAYICAGATNQTPGGWENAPGGYKFHVNNYYGFPVRFSMTGSPADTTMGYDLLNLSYDAIKNAVYTDKEIYPAGKMIADLDDSQTFLNTWNGFTNGKVRLSITGVDYRMETMGLVITEIDGKEPKKAVETDFAPIINVDYEGEVPYALVNKEYAIFNATAFDTHEGVKDVAVNVYYNYGKENQTVCNIVNGQFIPKREGVYTIVYTACDDMGQRSEEVVNVQAVVGSGFTAELVGKVEKGYTGKESLLFEDVSYQNESGAVSYRVTVNGEEIEPKNGQYYFLPLNDGVYSVNVKIKDYVKEENITYDFSTIKNYTPQIFDEIVLPKYLVQGEELKLPEISGYDFSSGKGKQYETQIFVKESGEEEKEISGNVYTPTKEGNLEIIYRLNVSGRKAEKKVNVSVVSVFEGNDLHIEKFFKQISGDAEMGATANNVTLTATKKSAVEFVNRVQVKDFYMTFVFDETFNAVGKVNIYFTDIYDSSKTVKFTYTKNYNGSASFSLNDGTMIAVDASFISDQKNFMLTYSDGIVYGSSSVYLPISQYLDGRAFEGFAQDMAYLTIELDNVKGKSVMCLKNLNRQSLNDANKDRFAPQIMADAIVGERTLNDVIEINSAMASDVLSNDVDFVLKVTAPDGNYAVAKDGTKLDGVENNPNKKYELALSSYGDYYIEYVAVDRFNKEKSLAFYVTVRDSVSPTVTLGTANRQAKVGDTVTVASVTATDNISENLTVFICVENTDGQTDVVENNKFVADKKGVYTVKYMVWDEAGNYTFKSYTVTVR